MMSFSSWAWFKVLNPLWVYIQLSRITNVRPLDVVNCLALLLLSRLPAADCTPAAGYWLLGIRKTWLARNSSVAAKFANWVPVSRSFELRRTSVVGTKRIYYTSQLFDQQHQGNLPYVVLNRQTLSRYLTAKEMAYERVEMHLAFFRVWRCGDGQALEQLQAKSVLVRAFEDGVSNMFLLTESKQTKTNKQLVTLQLIHEQNWLYLIFRYNYLNYFLMNTYVIDILLALCLYKNINTYSTICL